jgi:hypothetical protein
MKERCHKCFNRTFYWMYNGNLYCADCDRCDRCDMRCENEQGDE